MLLDWWYTPQRLARKLRKWECEYHQLHPNFYKKPHPLPLDAQSYGVLEHHHVQFQKRLQKALSLSLLMH